ncbi:MAG TPA: hypothetical protein VGO27_19560 [Candidatus Acidoferrum sp.]|jgi:hypothetical protein|nr:hypothetical protein [Candidatus Acidoferrum sp.]
MATSGIASRPIAGISVTTKGVKLLQNYFYFSMSLLIAAVVTYGFSHTVNENLLHPTAPRPFILYLHAAVFTGWLLFFILQSVLVRTGNVRVHRKIGWFGAGLGAAIPVVGVATAVAMARFNMLHQRSPGSDAFLIVPLFDVTAFIIPFALAIYWRAKPEFHRRLVLIATCALTAAGFGRFPNFLMPENMFYAGVDVLIFLGVVRDLIVNRRIHPVYLCALPAFILGQIFVVYTYTHTSPWWMATARAILR